MIEISVETDSFGRIKKIPLGDDRHVVRLKCDNLDRTPNALVRIIDYVRLLDGTVEEIRHNNEVILTVEWEKLIVDPIINVLPGGRYANGIPMADSLTINFDALRNPIGTKYTVVG